MNSAKICPDAILLACWSCEDPLLNQLGIDPLLLSLGDKPMLQRAMEKIVRLGCREIVVVLGDRPQACRDLLGDGERWGCHIHYCYACENRPPLAVLSRYQFPANHTCVIASADSNIMSELPKDECSAICWNDSGFVNWTGWARLSSGQIRQLIIPANNRGMIETNILSELNLRRQRERKPIATSEARLILNSLPQLFFRSPGEDGIMRHPSAPDIWLGKGSSLAPDARLIAPVYIGNHVKIGAGACIGPNAVIGDGCVIEANCNIESSLVMPGTYLGSALDMSAALVSPAGVANVRLDAVATVSDANLLADMNPGAELNSSLPYWQSLLACALYLLCWPLAYGLRMWLKSGLEKPRNRVATAQPQAAHFKPAALNPKLRHELPSHELIYQGYPHAWISHFLVRFQPGLAAVIAGKLSLIGLQPRSIKEIASLPDYWQALYRAGKIGLINESLLMGADGSSEQMRYAGDALAVSDHSPLRTLRLLLRYARYVADEIPVWCNSTDNKEAALYSSQTLSQTKSKHRRSTPHKHHKLKERS
jgi:hypothetical protein